MRRRPNAFTPDHDSNARRTAYLLHAFRAPFILRPASTIPWRFNEPTFQDAARRSPGFLYARRHGRRADARRRAQPAAGEIVSLNGDTLVLHRANADNVTIEFKSDVPVGAVKNVKLADNKPGTYVGAASVPDASGKQIAKEVLVFPEAMRGSGEGHYAWDLLPGSMMTNANVDTVVQGNSGRELTTSYKGGTKVITVPENTPVVTFTDATRSDVIAGKKAFIVAKLAALGKHTALRVIVEKDGVAPPM